MIVEMNVIVDHLVAVELQLLSDFLFLLHGKSDGFQHKIHTLTCSYFVRDNTIVKQIPDYRQIKNSLTCVDIRNARDPFVVRLIGLKLFVQQVFVFVKLLPPLSWT